MNLVKQYIIQSISAASNNLRLSTQKIEVVALLREVIIKSNDIENDIKKMKKITELSKLAIRLNEIYTYLTNGQIDFFKLSEKFKEQSQYLIKDLSHMLEMVNPATFKKALEKLNPPLPPQIIEEIINESIEEKENGNEAISIDLSKRKTGNDIFGRTESEAIKEKLILEEDKVNEDNSFHDYEESILKPIKLIDHLLKKFSESETDAIDNDELNKFSEIMQKNAELSSKIGFEILSNMHSIVANSLSLISARELMPGKDIIESIRACLIVIVAVVKGKEVDITNYLNRAEDFGKQIQI